MRIYFEDGLLIEPGNLPEKVQYVVHAEHGVNNNIVSLDAIQTKNSNAVVYTNSIFAFNNRYAWNEELKLPEIYIRAGTENNFVRIDELTYRELKEGHNLAKMYVSGEFDEGKKSYDKECLIPCEIGNATFI